MNSFQSMKRSKKLDCKATSLKLQVALRCFAACWQLYADRLAFAA